VVFFINFLFPLSDIIDISKGASDSEAEERDYYFLFTDWSALDDQVLSYGYC
jgi:hypothetical protein